MMINDKSSKVLDDTEVYNYIFAFMTIKITLCTP